MSNWMQATEEEKYAAMRQCESLGGSFAHHLAKAWFQADSTNRNTLDLSFSSLFGKYLSM